MSGQTISTIFTYVIIFVAMMLPGFAMSKFGKISKNAIPTLSNILVYIAMPCLVFSKICEIDFSTIKPIFILISVLFPILFEFSIFALSKIIFSYDKNNATRKAAQICSIFSNCGFLGIPLACAVWPENPEVVLYISIFNCVSAFQLLTLGRYILSGDKNTVSAKNIITSPIFISIVMGIIFSAINKDHSCNYILTFTTHLANLTTPLSMLVLGYQLSNSKLTKYLKNKTFYLSIFVKLILSPIITLVAVHIFRACGLELSQELILALLISTGISCAATIPSLCALYDADGEFAASITIWSTIIVTATLPLMFLIFEHFYF